MINIAEVIKSLLSFFSFGLWKQLGAEQGRNSRTSNCEAKFDMTATDPYEILGIEHPCKCLRLLNQSELGDIEASVKRAHRYIFILIAHTLSSIYLLLLKYFQFFQHFYW